MGRIKAERKAWLNNLKRINCSLVRNHAPTKSDNNNNNILISYNIFQSMHQTLPLSLLNFYQFRGNYFSWLFCFNGVGCFIILNNNKLAHFLFTHITCWRCCRLSRFFRLNTQGRITLTIGRCGSNMTFSRPFLQWKVLSDDPSRA